MKFQVELRFLAGDQEKVHPIMCLEREGVALETLGLTLAKGKAILKAIQELMVEKPLTASLNEQKITPSSDNFSLNVVATDTLSITASTATPVNRFCSSREIPSFLNVSRSSGSTSSRLFNFSDFLGAE